jgi:spore germination cell wall hydrolase CwlJ-like protein
MMMQKPFELAMNTFYPNPNQSIETQIEPILFCMVVWGESRNQTTEGQQSVGDVIMNRWSRGKKYWGKSVAEIITKKSGMEIYQFSCMNKEDVNYNKMMKPDALSWYQVAQSVLPIYFSPKPLTLDSCYYYCTQKLTSSMFFSKLRPVKTIGDHVFFTDIGKPSLT